jgi:uncharacterized low-complexity protein
MSKQSTRKPLSLALGAAAIASLGVSGIANAAATGDLFAMDELNSGYLTAGGHEKEGSCGEGKCGADKDGDKDGEGSCGEDKGGEGSCGEDKDGSS